MKIVGRQDRALLVGLAVAIIVVSAKPIRYLLDLARDVESSSGLALVPALIILTVVFVFHQQGKRQEARTRAATAEADAQQAGERASEMERLANFGHALGRSLDRDSIQDVVAQHLPKLAGTEDAWVLLRASDQWVVLAGPARDARSEPDRVWKRVADAAVATDGAWESDAIAVDNHLCLPLTVGGHAGRPVRHS